MATRGHELPRSITQDSDREAILAVIASEQMIPIEELLRALPWIRWGEVFSILGLCLEDGSIVLEKRGWDFEVGIKISSPAEAFGQGKWVFDGNTRDFGRELERI